MNHLLIYIFAGGAMLCLLAFIIYTRKAMPFFELYREGIRLENKGNFMEATKIYSLLLDEYKKAVFKDRQLMREAERRIKTLQQYAVGGNA